MTPDEGTGGAVVIGVGNPMRRDDGVGHAVLEQLRARPALGVRLVALDGEPTRVLDAWTGARVAVVVDAVRSAAAPGTVHVVEVTTSGGGEGDARPGVPPPSAAPASTHGAGLAEAVALGRTLDRVPARLVLVGVEALDVGDGPELSAPVLAAVPVAVDAVLAVVRGGRVAAQRSDSSSTKHSVRP